MPVFETYASRVAAAAKAGRPDVYTYDELPPLLRKQISQIFTECIGPGRWEPKGFVPRADVTAGDANEVWGRVAKDMDREVGSFSHRTAPAYEYCMEYLRRSADLNGVLSLIELCANIMADAIINDNAWHSYD